MKTEWATIINQAKDSLTSVTTQTCTAKVLGQLTMPQQTWIIGFNLMHYYIHNNCAYLSAGVTDKLRLQVKPTPKLAALFAQLSTFVTDHAINC